MNDCFDRATLFRKTIQNSRNPSPYRQHFRCPAGEIRPATAPPGAAHREEKLYRGRDTTERSWVMTLRPPSRRLPERVAAGRCETGASLALRGALSLRIMTAKGGWFALVSCLCVASAAGPQAAPTIRLEPVLTTGLVEPTYVTNAREGSKRLFIVEQAGRIKVLDPGAAAPRLFLDITSRILSGGARGLLGLAFHPALATNRRFFVDYTRRPDGATVVAEYRVSADPSVADSA